MIMKTEEEILSEYIKSRHPGDHFSKEQIEGIRESIWFDVYILDVRIEEWKNSINIFQKIFHRLFGRWITVVRFKWKPNPNYKPKG